MKVKFTVDTNGYPSHVRILINEELHYSGYPISPAEAMQLGAMLLQAGQYIMNDETNKMPLVKDIEIDTIQTKRY